LTEEKFIELGFFTKDIADYLKKRVTEGGGFLLAGKGGSGKTTGLNWLIDQIPEYYSGLVIQENEELFSNHPDMAFEHTVINRGEGKIEYTLGDLARNGLLTDIDYFIIGEIKGGEALYLLNAIYTGAKGWASVHGASAREAMKKLTDYIKYNSDYTQEEALEMLVHLDTVVFMENFKVKEIAEVAGFDEEKGDLIYRMICENGRMLKEAKEIVYKQK
jgi:pilus assembly protein CpaF